MSALVTETDPLVGVVVLGVLAAIAMVWVAALINAIRVPDDSLFRSGSKTVWVLVIIFLGIVGAIIYFAVGEPTTQAWQRFGEVRGRKAGSSDTSRTAGANAAPRKLSGPTIVWTHAGVRYLAGYTVQDGPYYGIWDRSHPGPPSLKFPYTEHGKAEFGSGTLARNAGRKRHVPSGAPCSAPCLKSPSILREPLPPRHAIPAP